MDIAQNIFTPHFSGYLSRREQKTTECDVTISTPNIAPNLSFVSRTVPKPIDVDIAQNDFDLLLAALPRPFSAATRKRRNVTSQ